MSETVQYARYASPIGELLLAARGGRLFQLRMLDGPADPRLPEGGEASTGGFLDDVRAQLDAYFHGRSRGFDLPTAAEGTPFQARVWAELSRIPYGETVSYAELARRVGDPRAARAVGGANGRNPLAVVVPCHRVIAAGGRLGGFGGGLERKLWLLQHEAHVVGREVPAAWLAR